jgi:iron complex transport system substrate-binding protein
VNPTARSKANPNLRIVSLVPSLTETVATLGLATHIVGCTNYCVSPRQIGRWARRIGGTKNPDPTAIQELNPSHILANSEENKPECLELLRQACPSATLWVTQLQTLDDSIALVDQAAHLFAPWHPGAAQTAEEWANRVLALRSQIQRLRLHLQSPTDAADLAEPQTFLYLIWRDPWMVAGDKTYISSLLSEGGLRNCIVTSPHPTERYPNLALCPTERWGSVHWVLFSSEPYHFLKRHMNQFCKEFLEFADFSQRMMQVDGKALSWFGTGSEDGLKEVLRILNFIHIQTQSARAD